METYAVNNLGLLLHDAARLVRKRFELRSRDLELPPAQWRLLIRLMREGTASQVRLAELLEIEPISVSRLVDRMTEGGWVTRERDTADRRVNIVAPTRKACDAFEVLRGMTDSIYAEALAGVPPAERAILISALGAVIANLSASEPSESRPITLCEAAAP